MMDELNIRLFGSPEVSLNGMPLTGFRSDKARALLYYLIATGEEQPRTHLAGLLWGDVAENHARRNLSSTLSNVRKLAGAFITVGRDTIGFAQTQSARLDIQTFNQAAASNNIEQLQTAVELYGGDFLDGFYIQDAPDFEQWMLLERSHLRDQMVSMLDKLATYYVDADDLSQAIDLTRRILHFQPWYEEAHRSLIHYLAQSGQRGAALMQFDLCCKVLAEELNVGPEKATVDLVEQIKTGGLQSTIADFPQAIPSRTNSTVEGQITKTDSSPITQSLPPNNLLAQLTPFIGRRDEVDDVIQKLCDPACRLLTLVGPGGSGKTRLALQVAEEILHQQKAAPFSQGVYFVSLVEVHSQDRLISALADAVDIHFHGAESLEEQLLAHLSAKSMLLVLDNFEHLVNEADPILRILRAAPDLTFCVTSRVALNLKEAWFYPVRGLTCPQEPISNTLDLSDAQANGTTVMQSYDAIRLFDQCAQRARTGFSSEQEIGSVVRICQLVDGLPLAIELAASWLKIMPPADVASELEQSLDILTTRHENVADRHRSMRVVLEQAWQLLTPREQMMFQHMALFRAGFQREAAQVVADATLMDLAIFVEKSLLHVAQSGRYQIHALLRQYALEKLATSPEQWTQAHDAHCTYYLNYLADRRSDLKEGQQIQAAIEIGQEVDNIWAAWRYALQESKFDTLQKPILSIQLFCQFRSQYQLGANLWSETFSHLSTITPTPQIEQLLAEISIYWGWLLIRLGQLEEAEQLIEGGLQRYRQLELPYVDGLGTDPRIPLSIIATIRGDYATAIQLGQKAYTQSVAEQHEFNICMASYALASALLPQGNCAKAEEYAVEAYDVIEGTGDRWFMAYCHNTLGEIALGQGKMKHAQHHFEASYQLRREFGDPEGMALALTHMGQIALAEADYERANQLYTESLTIYHDLNDKGGLAHAHRGVGTAALQLGDHTTAQEHLRRALHLAHEIDFVSLQLSLLVTAGKFMLIIDQQQRGAAILRFIRHFAHSNQSVQSQAQHLLTQYQIESPNPEQALLSEQTLESVVQNLLDGKEWFEFEHRQAV